MLFTQLLTKSNDNTSKAKDEFHAKNLAESSLICNGASICHTYSFINNNNNNNNNQYIYKQRQSHAMALAGDSGYLPPIRYVFRFRRNVNSDSSGDRRDAGRRHYCQCSAGIFWFSVYFEVNSGLSRAEAICKGNYYTEHNFATFLACTHEQLS